ncbi:TIGR04150 pseudo-rSAM protein [Bacteroides faecichinchillae]|uniref:TIGR04150 pseudo-rSAM protein n=1 Tax=Bacteroides faecichinchillae TaxID=871325 RepID=UPI003512B116
MKKYWLVLSPNTFMWLKGEEGLLYHAVSHAQVSFKNVGALRLLTEWINDIDNLYRVELTEETLRQLEVNEWIRQVVDKECGKLVENDDVNNCPVSLKPVLKLQDGVQYYEWLHRQGTDGSVIQNLHNIVFYLNGSASGDEWLHRQLIYPSATETVADRMRVVHFARNARQSPYLLEISLVGNLFAIPQLAEEVEALQTICPVMLYVTVEDALHALPQVKVWADRQAIRILVKDYVALKTLLDAGEWSTSLRFTLIVTSIQTYENATEIVETYGLEHAELIPAFTGDNRSFFEENLYMDVEELAEIALSKRDIFIRQTLNIADFGKLYIEPDGKVYANLNDKSIGMIDNSPHDLVYRELTEGNAWLHIRNEEPCCECVYQWLCPSPSNYERVIGKPNLCTKIKK